MQFLYKVLNVYSVLVSKWTSRKNLNIDATKGISVLPLYSQCLKFMHWFLKHVHVEVCIHFTFANQLFGIKDFVCKCVFLLLYIPPKEINTS